MATVLNSISPTANPSLICARNAHALNFMYMYSNSNSIPSLHLGSLKKRVSKKLASFTTTQMSVTSKETFLIPDRKGSERDDTVTEELLLLYDAYKHFKYKVGLGHKPDPVHGEELLYALYKWGELKKAITVAEMMLTSGVKPNTRLSFLCRHGNVGQVMQLMEKLEEYGYPIDNNVCTAIVTLFSKRGSLSLRVLERLLRKGMVCNECTYSVLLEVVCREKGMDVAVRVFDEIVSNGVTLDLVHYNVLLTGFCNEGRIDDAIWLFKDLPSKGFHPNVASCNILLSSLYQENRWEEATALLTKMGQGLTIATYNIVIGSLAQQGEVDAAFGLLNDMKRASLYPYAASYNVILDPICTAGKVDLAFKCIDLMISSRCRATERTYNAVAGLYRHRKALDGFTLIHRLWNTHRIPDTERSHVMLCLCKNGNISAAFQLLCLMKKDGFVPGSYTFHSLIRDLFAAGKGEEAMEVVSVMEEFGYRPSMHNFNSLIVGLCELGRTDLSFEVFYTMIEKGYKPDEKTYVTLVQGIAREDERELAEEVLKELHQKEVLSTNVVERVCMKCDFKSVSTKVQID